MRVDAFDYELPEELIAQEPTERREQARLLVVPPVGPLDHRQVSDLADLVPSGALVVVNDTRVVPARLLAQKKTGGRAEVFLVRRVGTQPLAGGRSAQVWRALGKASKGLKAGAELEISPREAHAGGQPALRVRVLGRASDDGLLEVAVWTPDGGPVEDALRASGHVPLPPYIRREDRPLDAERYQTVYARHDGAVAAPTAGLHLSQALLDRIEAKGCALASVTLHVGLGTFQRVDVDDLDAHLMHAERCIVPGATADAVAAARARGAPVVAIGTTSVRALESAADPARPGHVVSYDADTKLLIQPGYTWRVVDGLLTNFHLPRSTLLALVCAFAGRSRVLDAYAIAVHARYRFFSYGDAMLLWRGP
jgi:S-adenosylmethionine:tRNA ribosyltransferase-isomerase